jgi:hypothetical protein
VTANSWGSLHLKHSDHITARVQLIIKSLDATHLYLFAGLFGARRCLFARSQREHAFLIFASRGTPPPKIIDFERGNMGAQIYVNFDRYISIPTQARCAKACLTLAVSLALSKSMLKGGRAKRGSSCGPIDLDQATPVQCMLTFRDDLVYIPMPAHGTNSSRPRCR